MEEALIVNEEAKQRVTECCAQTTKRLCLISFCTMPSVILTAFLIDRWDVEDCGHPEQRWLTVMGLVVYTSHVWLLTYLSRTWLLSFLMMCATTIGGMMIHVLVQVSRVMIPDEVIHTQQRHCSASGWTDANASGPGLPLTEVLGATMFFVLVMVLVDLFLLCMRCPQDHCACPDDHVCLWWWTGSDGRLRVVSMQDLAINVRQTRALKIGVLE